MFEHKTDSGHVFHATGQADGTVAIQMGSSGSAGGAMIVNTDDAQVIATGIRDQAAYAIQLRDQAEIAKANAQQAAAVAPIAAPAAPAPAAVSFQDRKAAAVAAALAKVDAERTAAEEQAEIDKAIADAISARNAAQ